MREQELTKILEAYSRLRQTQDWNTIQELYVKPQLKNVEVQMFVESLSNEIDSKKLYRLQGQREMAILNDVDRVIERLTAELKGIKQTINES